MLVSINPANGQKIAEFPELSDEELSSKLNLAAQAFSQWRISSIDTRKDLMYQLIRNLNVNKDDYAKLITTEMGKPIKQSIAEIDKCVTMAEIYTNDIERFLQDEHVNTAHKESFITFEPLGAILAVMPWNFPFWQVLRFAVPNVLLGNVCLLKHASNVQGCANELEKLFLESGFPVGVFQNLPITAAKVESVIRSPHIKAVTLTGSEAAGASVAAIAGSEIKKTVLELGGSDPFIVLADADLLPVCQNAVHARLRNAGQACTSAKRFIVVKDVVEEFTHNYANYFRNVVVGNPMDDVDVGPLASESALKEIELKVQKSVEMGAQVVVGGKRIQREGFYFEPTILTNVRKGMPVYEEEVFGPVASIIVAEDEDDAIRIANDTKYGLAASIWTKDIQKAKTLAQKIEAGSVYINAIVSSDVRMPFGGIKKSGYGRELSVYGLREFVNIKTVIVE